MNHGGVDSGSYKLRRSIQTHCCTFPSLNHHTHLSVPRDTQHYGANGVELPVIKIAMAAPCVCTPLSSPRNIRLVILKPDCSLDSTSQVAIEKVSLDCKPPAHTPRVRSILRLGSGHWHSIRYGQRPCHLVTESCDLALRYLGYPNAERTLWVDALCITELRKMKSQNRWR